MTEGEVSRRPPLWRRALANAALLVGSIVFILLLLELGVRIFASAPNRQGKQILSLHRLRNAEPLNRGADCYPTNPRGYFERVDPAEWNGSFLIPADDYAKRAKMEPEKLLRTPWCVPFRTNQHAHRGRDHAVARAPNTFRVLVVGDSFVYGEGVKDADTMPAQLERILQERHADLAVEVVNLGRPGADTEGEVKNLELHADLAPDVVVLGYVLNDAFRAKPGDKTPVADDFILMRPGRFGDPGTSWLRWSRLYQFVASRIEQHRVHEQTLAWYRDAFDPEKNAKGLEKTERLLGEFAATTRKTGGALLVAIYPILYRLGDGYPFVAAHAHLQSILDRLGMPWLDLRGALGAKKTEALVVHPIDRHPNDLAQRLAAEAIAGELERRGLVKARAP